MKRSHFIVIFVLACLLAWNFGFASVESSNSIERFAIIIGNNRGLAKERPLKYAAKDASELSRVLIRGQSFEDDRVYCLQNQSLDNIRNSFSELRGRLLEVKKIGKKTLVMAYFSGHGSKGGLHVEGRVWNRDEFLATFDELQSDLKVLILDACESGDFLRSKGMKLIDERVIEREDYLGSHGRILLSASSKGEAAQESEDYRGAVFTHHLLNGIRGLADYDQDGQIRLLEAFDYAQTATKKENHLGESALQTPSFDFDVVGENDPVLARLEKKDVMVQFVGMDAGTLRVFAYPYKDVAYHLYLTGRKVTQIAIPSGRYLFALGDEEKWLVAESDLRWGSQAQIRLENFRPKPRPFFTPKGGAPLSLWQEHTLMPSVRKVSVVDDVPFIEFNYSLNQSTHDIHLTLGYGRGRESLSPSGLRQQMTHYRVGLGSDWPVFTHWGFQTSLGVEVSAIRVLQEVHDSRLDHTDLGDTGLRSDTERGAWIYGLSLPITISLDLPWRMRLLGSWGPAAYTYREVNQGRVFSVRPEYRLGGGLRF